MQHPIEVLERYWNFTSFRPLQEDIISSVLDNEDTFALLPTGGGKSICFQIPALIREGICIVISPLVALMKDQVSNLNAKGIKAIALTSGISYSELDQLLDNCIYGNYKFLYLSPERLQQSIVKERIQQMNVNLIAVDEAHCISQWGNDFRPAYLNITSLRELHPHVNVIALTATAKSKVIEETLERLDCVAPKIYKGSFRRPNIAYHVLHSEDKLYTLEQILKKYDGSSIIYVRSRNASEDIDKHLRAKGFSSTFYHGGIDSDEKQNRLNQWLHDQKTIMVATTAFGMGIDKPNVKTVVHINLPESLESYYQEAGRAGRNGDTSFAVILKQNADEDQLKGQFLKTLPSVDFIKLVYKKLNNYFQISYGEGEHTSHQLNFNLFCNTYELNKTLTYNALKILDRNSIIGLSQQFSYQTKLQFIITNEQLFSYIEKFKDIGQYIKVILRTYGGVFDHMTKINTFLIANKINVKEKEIINALNQLQNDNIIEFQTSNTDAEITFLVPREDEKTINPIVRTIEQQHRIKEDQIKSVLDYVNNTEICKSVQLLNYFDEYNSEACGQCSVCSSKIKGVKHSGIKSLVLELLKTKSLSSRELVEKSNYSEDEIINCLRELLEDNTIEITTTNRYRLKA
ncbi:RecQ family ATP-dependent DNA helicase [Winogradskyella sp. 3972H.M.0a.05]|uniref:RecQ family ATP-dependent DNA helicase n=1 Tax=Winogradskyella sp. 3972H.M.0a.05 TaxID=2950277 RepID=UPI003395C8BB